MNVLAPNFVFVVQGGVGYRHPTNEYRSQTRDRRQRPGSSDLNINAKHLGAGFFGRIFVRHRPARLTRHEAKLILKREGIDFIHDAIDIKRQVGTAFANALMKIGQSLRPAQNGPLGTYRKAEGDQRIEDGAMRCRN